MSKKLYEEASVQAIAAAIRGKTGGSETYTIGQMAGAVAALTGGGETWELIRYIKVPEGAAEANELTINTDENGNAFALKRAKLFSVFPAYTGETKIPSYSFFRLNGATTGSNSPYCYTSGFVVPAGTVRRTSSVEVDLSKPGLQVESVTRSYGSTGIDYFGPARITEITSIGGTSMLIYPGCEFWLYGVRG